MKYKVLVNKENKIKDKFLSRIELITTKDVDDLDVQVEKETYSAYLKLKEFLATKNIIIGIASAYRSKEYQQEIYDEYIKKYGKDYADKVVAPVGCSEHHTGLAIDINIMINGTWPSSNNELMEQVEHYKAIHKYLADYGFILRYPEGKEDITGYPYEPWHIRYTGKTVAKIIEKENYTLEEYLSDYSGVIVVNKKSNMTSFDVVNEISRTLGIKKLGHTGTLDPLAEGVLVVTVGKATKIAELLTATYKEYQAGVILGVETDTLDITGKITNSKIVPDNLPIEKVLKSFKKTYLQEVPIYSAVKVKGKKLYEYARENKPGESLDTYATMTNLTRTKQGKYTLTDAYTLEDISSGNFNLLKIEDVLDYPKIVADEKLSFKIKSGQKLKNTYNIKNKVLFIDQNNKLLGIYQVENEDLKVWKNFV